MQVGPCRPASNLHSPQLYHAYLQCIMHALHWLSAGRSAFVSGMRTTTALLL